MAGVETRLALRLKDGRLLRLAGLDPADTTPLSADRDELTRAQLAARLVGQEVTWDALADRPDRWGRLPALVFRTAAAAPGGVAGEAIGLGFGRYLAESTARACRSEFLAAEAKARAAKLGLWDDPYYSVLAVDDRVAFTERSATLIVAEGRLAAVEPSPYRTTLRFMKPDPRTAPRAQDVRPMSEPGVSEPESWGGHMLVATIRPRILKSFQAQGMNLQGLTGRRLRVRGLLDTRFGPRLDLDGPDAIEVLPAEALPSQARPAPNTGTSTPH